MLHLGAMLLMRRQADSPSIKPPPPLQFATELPAQRVDLTKMKVRSVVRAAPHLVLSDPPHPVVHALPASRLGGWITARRRNRRPGLTTAGGGHHVPHHVAFTPPPPPDLLHVAKFCVIIAP